VTDTEMTMAMGHGAVGEDSPFRIESKKLVMWLFIVADAATFGAILFGYGYLRVGSLNWTRPFAVSSILNGIVMTVVLLSSSVTMLAAVRAAQAGGAHRRECVRWLAVTALLGVIFAVLHLREWFGLFAEGWSPSRNPMGGPVLVGGTFFGITGLHLLHVVIGVVALTTVAIAFARGRLQAGHIETTGLYWHFVDLVWMFVFPLVYLMNAR
jgi:cytochrome c oxidase subunit III